MSKRQTAMKLGLAGAFATASVFAAAGTATAAPNQDTPTKSASAKSGGCWYSGSHWWCNNVSGAKVMYTGLEEVAGYMNTNPSWFHCRAEATVPHGGGGPHPNRWVHTQADNGEWGWMADYNIASETNTLPNCP